MMTKSSISDMFYMCNYSSYKVDVNKAHDILLYDTHYRVMLKLNSSGQGKPGKANRFLSDKMEWNENLYSGKNVR